MAFASEAGDELAFLFFFENHLDGDPGLVGQARNGGAFFGGEEGNDLGQLVFRHVHLQADLGLGFDCAAEQHAHVLHLFPFPGNGPGGFAGNEAGGAGEQGIDDAQIVGAKRRAGFGGIDNGVEQAGLDLGGAPGEFHGNVDVACLEICFGGIDQLGGDDAAF